MTPTGREASYRLCVLIARRKAVNFYPAFLLLPRSQRRAMCALYAFLRRSDDLVDGPEPTAIKEQRLMSWRDGLIEALAGRYRHPIFPALHHTVARFSIPPEHLFAVLDGVASDLNPVSIATFSDLTGYCRLVASAVGLACLPIWGCRRPEAFPLAEQAGIAFQLTNILRDLGEDRDQGRIYLPEEEWRRFECPPDQWQDHNPRFREMMTFQISRARRFYAQGDRLQPMLPSAGRAVFTLMSQTYQSLLDAIERRNGDVFLTRVRVPRPQKARLFVRACLSRCLHGW